MSLKGWVSPEACGSQCGAGGASFGVQEGLETHLGGVLFSRTDFKNGPTYEAVLVKACNSQVLVFIFTGSDRGAAVSLIRATHMKLNLASFGCGADASGLSK